MIKLEEANLVIGVLNELFALKIMNIKMPYNVCSVLNEKLGYDKLLPSYEQYSIVPFSDFTGKFIGFQLNDHGKFKKS